MEELEDIVLIENDIVKYVDKNGQICKVVIAYDKKASSFDYGKILQIERPTYKTIYEAPKQILDKEEKEWLENFLRPFKNRVNGVYKKYAMFTQDKEEIVINYDKKYGSCLPHFAKGTMYKGMEPNKEYTLDELGLFKEVVVKD